MRLLLVTICFARHYRHYQLAALLCLFLMCQSQQSHALNPNKSLREYVHLSWSVDKGLPQSTVRAIAQTSDGYIWLATHEGLIRFDGRQFFTYNEANAPALTGNGISALLATRDGTLWVGLRDGGVVRHVNSAFTLLAAKSGIPTGTINSLRLDGSNHLWIGSNSGGVGIVDLVNNTGRVVTVSDGLPSSAISAIEVTDKTSVYVGTSRGLSLFENRKLISKAASNTALNGLATASITAITQDRRGQIWVSAKQKGLYVKNKTDEGNQAWQLVKQDKHTVGISDQITRLLVDSDDALWIGSLDGLHRLRKPKNSDSAPTIETLNAKDGLSSNDVRDLIEDAEGNIWVGTEGGLDRYRDGLISMWDNARGITEEFSRTVMEDRRGNIWVGTADGLFRFNADGSEVKRFDRQDGLISTAILSMAESSDGTLWIGTNLGGLYKIDTSDNNRLINMSTQFGLDSGHIRVILPSRDGALWIGSANGLVRIIDTLTNNARVDVISTDATTRIEQVLSIYEDSKADVWIGTRNGLYIYRDNRLSRFTPTLNAQSFSNAVYAILETTNGMLLTTGRGLMVIQADKARLIGSQQGLPNRVYFRILDGDANSYWLCGNQGMVRLAKAELNAVLADPDSVLKINPQMIDRADGMTTNQCNGGSQPAGWRTRDGRIMFPTARGVAVFDPEQIVSPNYRPPPVHIVSITVDNKTVASNKMVILPSGQHRLEFSFVALSFVDTARIRYRYRLEGFDNAWVDAGGEPVATYTNIPAGEYRFHVIAANNDGVWNEIGTSVAILQKASITQTPLFRVIVGIIVLLLLISIYLARTKRLAIRARQLERLVETRTIDLEAQRLALEVANLDKAALLDKIQAQSQAFEALAKEDSLTGLANRRELDIALNREWQRVARSRAPLAVIITDIDYFKQVNDQYSHAVGDAVIRQFAQLLIENRRQIDIIARYGGEEFVLLLPDTNLEAGIHLAERLRERIDNFAWHTIAEGLHVTASFGVAEASQIPTEANAERLVMAADANLYQAKARGRNCVVG
jgi:diguanylate cyclase (GGDEF)-like protein